MKRMITIPVMLLCLVGRILAVEELHVTTATRSESTTATSATPEQIALLQSYPKSDVGFLNDRIAGLVKNPTNQAIAVEAVRLLESEFPKNARTMPLWWKNLAYFLECRADDGPYLTNFVRVILRRVEQELEEPPGPLNHVGVRPLTAYLAAHPEDEELRKNVGELARKYAKVSEHQNEYQLTFSWAMLLLLGDLNMGMPAADAQRLLGSPTSSTDDHMEWYRRSPAHVNPFMRADLEGAKVKRFTTGNR